MNNIMDEYGAVSAFQTLYEAQDSGILESGQFGNATNIPGFKQTVKYAPKYSQAEIDKKEKKSKIKLPIK